MSFYRECPNCGAHLDPGEKCDCEQLVDSAPDTRTGKDNPTYPPHRCASCAWHGRGGEDCNEPNGGLNCKLYAPNAEAMEQARALIRQLQMAYRLHLCARQNKRLPWLAKAIDQLQAIAEGKGPRG